ncbi:MAG: GPR endopeptidase [Oscillospiraceae bacterium]|nr:GPR endopeptidase [Oscillospiraceae bacterium]
MDHFRTDMAEELRRQHTEDLEGVTCTEEALNGLSVFTVEIENERGASALGKAVGRYDTLKLPRWFDRGSDSFPDAVHALAKLITRNLPGNPREVLVAALGNPDITPDALGSLAASSVLVTRHLKRKEPDSFRGFCSLALCRPGVLGTSGVESALQVQTLCRELRPDLVVAIDALAGCEAEQLCRSVQVSSAGISPGSGVGNDRQELSEKTLDVPVLSVGMPTVIDAGFLGDGQFNGMFVTPRDIDSLVRAGARLIGYALNLALHRGIDIPDVDALIG